MFSHHNPAPPLTVDYWLPITKVNVTGSVVTATRTTHDGESVEHKPTPAIVSVVTRPDYDWVSCQLTMPADNWATHHVKMGLLADARLASVEASNQSGRATALTNILKFAGMGAGIGAIAGGPLGGVIGGAVGLAAAVVTLEVTELTDQPLTAEDTAKAQKEAECAFYKKLGILPDYADEHGEDARQLADLRIAEAKGRLAFAAAVKAPDGALQAIHRRLRLIRAELALSEAVYQKWLDSKLTTTTVSYDEEIAIADLPGSDGKPVEDTVKAWYTEPKPGSSLPMQSFHEACKNLGIAIGFWYEKTASDPWGTASPVPPPGQPIADDQVHYRPLRPGVLRVYAVTVTKSEHGEAVELRVRSTQRVLVTAQGYEKKVPLLAGKADRTLAVAFDTTGALTSISTDVTGAAISTAGALGELPGALKDAFTAGTELGKPFSAEGRAAALKAQVDEKKAREDLSASADPNRQLNEEVARAELEARLKVANRVAGGEASTAVVVMGGT